MARLLVRLVALALACAVWWPALARADSKEVASRVLEQWRRAGATGALLPSRFVFDDETMLVSLPKVEGEGGCTHVAVVAARGLSFRAKLSDATSDPLAPDIGARAASQAGVLELRRCDPRRPVRSVVVTSDAGRGAVEIVVVRAHGPLPSLPVVIPERTGGPLPPVPDVGVLPAAPAPEKRADVAEAAAVREGATIGARESLRAGDDGNGEGALSLGPGCHRVEVFARDVVDGRPARRFRLDVDAELRDLDEERLLARDRTEAPDARLEACVGRTTRVAVVYVGALPEGDVIVTRASWPLPLRLPSLWGPRAKGKMARVFFTRHVAVPADDPVFLGQGASGATPLPTPSEVGGCYLAVVAVTQGRARSLQLRAVVGARESSDERGAAEEAALAAYCVQAGERVRLEVQARGAGLQWGLAVFRVRSGVWEAGR